MILDHYKNKDLEQYQRVLNSHDRIGRTLLHYAVQYGMEPLTLELIERGVNIESLDLDSRDAWTYAVEYYRPQILKLIINHSGFSQKLKSITTRALEVDSWECFGVIL